MQQSNNSVSVAQEQVIQLFKAHKKFIEKEITASLNKMAVIKKQNRPEVVTDSFNAHILRLQQLQHEYARLIQEEEDMSLNVLIRLKPVDSPKSLQLVILDYMLRQGYFNISKTYCEQLNLKPYSDASVFQEIQEICSQLSEGNYSSALQFCSTHRSKLQKRGSKLEFKLHLCQFVKLLGSPDKAITYARQHLQKFADDEISALTEALGLLGFTPCQRELMQSFTKFKKNCEIVQLFKQEAYSLYGIPQTSKLQLIVQSGASALKMIYCSADRKSDCPTCDPTINKLAEKLPLAHITQTQVRCQVSGKLISESDTPFRMPSGYLISESEIAKLKQTPDGKFICPITDEAFERSDLRKVYFT